MADQTEIRGNIQPAENTLKFRRIVTGHSPDKKAIFIEDQICPNRFAMGGISTFVINEMWKMDKTPGSNEGEYKDPATAFTLNPPHYGNVFRIIEFPPNSELGMKEDGVTAEEPIMHRTPSIDYAYIIKGEVYAVMDDGDGTPPVETFMKEGDALIQRGTIHAWSNRSDKPVIILFVLCGADEIPGLPHK